MTHHFCVGLSSSSSPISWPATEYPKYVSALPRLTIGKRFSKLNATVSLTQQLNATNRNPMSNNDLSVLDVLWLTGNTWQKQAWHLRCDLFSLVFMLAHIMWIRFGICFVCIFIYFTIVKYVDVDNFQIYTGRFSCQFFNHKLFRFVYCNFTLNINYVQSVCINFVWTTWSLSFECHPECLHSFMGISSWSLAKIHFKISLFFLSKNIFFFFSE